MAGGCTTRIVGWAAWGFVRPPPHLAAKTMMTAASAGGQACPPPRLCARQQARTATRNDDDDEDKDNHIQRAMKALAAGNTRATRCVGGRRLATQSWKITGQRPMNKRTTNHCALVAGVWRPAERAASGEKGKDDANEERTSEEEEDYNNNEEEDCATATAAATTAAATAALPQATTPALPLLPLIKQWQQWQQHGIAACGGAR
jgi:hypothetical protein